MVIKMKKLKFDFDQVNIQRGVLSNLIFPLILLIFPLLKANQGIDLTDTGYSLGNYRFFSPDGGVWVLLTFLANVTGSLLSKLPFGGTMLGMKIYTGLLVSLTALIGYRFFKTKMPAWIAFAGEMAAIGFCWCPTVILYNYLTYFFFLLGAVLLFRGLAGGRNACLLLAGAVLGLNALVRFPNNILEAGLILALWYYGGLKKKPVKQIAGETGLCIAGYLASFAVMIGMVSVFYGSMALPDMVMGVFNISGNASDYTLGEMVLSILSAYGHGFRWMLYLFLCVLPGIPFLVIWEGKYMRLRKAVYCICIPILFFVLGKWGMYNFKYYQKESALQWGAVFLILALMVCVWMLFTGMLDDEWRLIGCIGLVIILITPLGSNNHIWPVLNNLFFTAPVIFWMIYRFVRWGRTYLDATGKVPLFPAKAMCAGVLTAFMVQALGIGVGYVFLDGELGEPRIFRVAENPVLAGMRTSSLNSEVLEEISVFMLENYSEYVGKELILYGNIPGLSYYLDMPPAIYTTWADLDSNPYERLKEELLAISRDRAASPAERPLVIITPGLAAYLSGDESVMEFWGVNPADYEKDLKLAAIGEFLESNVYEEVFANEAFVVYQ
ncbi:MAG: hypothetical protein NC429_02980 [Lachnospiraceae bacterium]|nr:hypothetical protein [Lachnospiraceae bacterium]